MDVDIVCSSDGSGAFVLNLFGSLVEDDFEVFCFSIYWDWDWFVLKCRVFWFERAMIGFDNDNGWVFVILKWRFDAGNIIVDEICFIVLEGLFKGRPLYRYGTE